MRFLLVFLKNFLSIAAALIVAYGMLWLVLTFPIIAAAVIVSALATLWTYFEL